MDTTATSLIPLIIEGIQDRKGRAITHIDLSGIPVGAASHFVVCQGTSTMQVAAIADHIREHLLDKAGVKPFNYDGYRSASWIVLDYGDTFVHVFLPETRSLYDLEELWSDARIERVPDLD